MKIRLYLDADAMDTDVVNALRQRGVDVETAFESGRQHDSDEDQLAYATTHGRVIFSFNVGDFMRLHTTYIVEDKTHAGIILAVQQRYGVGEQMRRLLRLISAVSADEMHNRIEFLSAWG